MMGTRLRNALAAFAMTVIVGSLLVGLGGFVVVVSRDASSHSVATAVVNVIKLIAAGVLGGGVLRTLTSIDARLEQRA